jgi:hypothetical protein
MRRATIKTTYLLTIKIIISGTANCRSIIEAADQPSARISLAKLFAKSRSAGNCHRTMKIERQFLLVRVARTPASYDRHGV